MHLIKYISTATMFPQQHGAVFNGTKPPEDQEHMQEQQPQAYSYWAGQDLSTEPSPLGSLAPVRGSGSTGHTGHKSSG